MFELLPAGAELLSAAAEVAAEVLARHAAEVDRCAAFPRESIDALARAGLLGLCLPEAVGGRAQPPRTFAAVVEELATECASTAMIFVMHVTAAQVVAASTTLVGRDALLTEMAAGRHLTTLALSEKGSRSQFWSPVSRLESKGAGYVTSALKSFVTAAGHAQSYVASAQVPTAQTPSESVLYLVRRGAPGVRTASAFDGLGLRGNDSAPVVFEGLPLGDHDLVTPLGGGARGMLEIVLPWFAVGSAAMATGLCRAAVAQTAAHLTATELQHTGEKLRDIPALRARLAQMSVATEQARALLAYTTRAMDAPDVSTQLYVLSARLAALDAALTVTDLAMKACGGAAYSRHLAIERLFRDARAGWVMAPTADHLADFIGKALTGLPVP